MKSPPIPALIPPMTDEEACESVIGAEIIGMGLIHGHVAVFLADGRSIVFEGCDRMLIEIKPRMH